MSGCVPVCITDGEFSASETLCTHAPLDCMSRMELETLQPTNDVEERLCSATADERAEQREAAAERQADFCPGAQQGPGYSGGAISASSRSIPAVEYSGILAGPLHQGQCLDALFRLEPCIDALFRLKPCVDAL